MIYSPTHEILGRMRAELAGVWVDRCAYSPELWLVAKLPTNLIREIIAGAAITLRVWIVEIEGYLVGAFGFTVYDDPSSPVTYYGSCRSDQETGDLATVLANGVCRLQIHNENFLPLMQALIVFDPDSASEPVTLLRSAKHPEERGFELRDKANDTIQASFEGGMDSKIKSHRELPIGFHEAGIIKVELKGIGEIDVSDPKEGPELEKLTMQAFESLFPYGTYLNTYYLKGKLQKEVCDVLAISRNREVETEGVFIIQNKVSSASTEGLTRKTERRALTIQKNILEAVKQLRKSIKALRSGMVIYHKDGISIDVDQDVPKDLPRPLEPLDLKQRMSEVGFALVVVSDLHPQVDWDKAVFLALGQLFIDSRFYCHVVDLMELGRLLTFCDNRPVKLEYILMERWKYMIQRRSAFIRFQFDFKPHASSSPAED